jgi:hypothetical protein
MSVPQIKSFISTIVAFLIIHINCSAQITDIALIKKFSINGICLCNTTLSALKQLNTVIKEVEVEEMDVPKNCFGQDSRFIAGTGFYLDNYPGMIFQKDQSTDQISKIRLTKQFSGKLPDGKFIDLSKLLLKDLFKMYPKLEKSWGSRGCSDYWNFSDSTLSFYVKIDKNKKPQFPIDEAYYADKPVEAVDLVVSCYSFEKHDDDVVILENPDDPVVFLDSIRVNGGVLANYLASGIASITVYKGVDAIKRVGPAGKNGLMYIQTKKFARRRYWEYFKSKSTEYAKLVPRPENDPAIQYILNKRLLKDNYEADLAAINDKTFKTLTIINKDQLIKDYGVKDKERGVIIVTDVAEK